MFGSYPANRPPFMPGLDPSIDTSGLSLAPFNAPPLGESSPTGATIKMGPRAGMPRRPSTGMFASRPSPAAGAIPGMDDINQALAANTALGQQKKDHRNKVLGDVAGGVAAAINGYLAAMGNPAGVEGLRNMHEMQMQRQKDAAQLAEEQAKLSSPRIEQVGDSLGYLDPSAGTFSPIFRDPQPFEAYATSLGYQPGTPEYLQAIEDYRAGTYGDAGVQGRLAVQAPRLDVTTRGQDLTHGDRQEGFDVRRRGQDLTHSDRVRGQDISRGNSVRSAETARGSYSYSHGGGSGRSHGAGAGDGATAVGPDGHTIVLRNGQWVDAQTGHPVQ